jgi:1-acyl-sn-glycerol-3-phosphate acyltransferase
MNVVRSLIFYVVFYGGSIPCVLGAVAAVPFGPKILRSVVRGWSRWHRFCVRWILGIRIEC